MCCGPGTNDQTVSEPPTWHAIGTRRKRIGRVAETRHSLTCLLFEPAPCPSLLVFIKLCCTKHCFEEVLEGIRVEEHAIRCLQVCDQVRPPIPFQAANEEKYLHGCVSHCHVHRKKERRNFEVTRRAHVCVCVYVCVCTCVCVCVCERVSCVC